MNRCIFNIGKLISTCLLCLVTFSSAGHTTPETSSNKTAAILFYANKHSENPDFALYDDGTVIFRPNVEETNSIESPYFTVTLSDAEKAYFINSLEKLASAKEFYKIQDSPTSAFNIFQIDILGVKKHIEVLGSLSADDSELVRGDQLPSGLIDLYDRLINFQDVYARPWLSGHYQVHVQPFEYAEKIIEWPNHWPDLHDPDTKKMGDDYILVLPSVTFQKFIKLANKCDHEKAVLISGKKWMIRSYKFIFPDQELVSLSNPLSTDNQIVREIKDNRQCINTLNVSDYSAYENYSTKLAQTIRKNWHPPKCIHLPVAVSFLLHKNGEVSGVRIEQSTNSPVSDIAALLAVHGVAPFDPLPECAPKQISVSIKFDLSNSLQNRAIVFMRLDERLGSERELCFIDLLRRF